MGQPRKRDKKEWWALRPRRCKYCRAIFTPSRPQDKDAKFCEPNHRKTYYRYGGLPFDKLMERVRKEIAKQFAELEKQIDAKITTALSVGADPPKKYGSQ